MRALLLLLTVTLAGCADERPDVDQEPLYDDPVTPVTLDPPTWVNVTLDLVATQARTPVNIAGFGGSNCAGFNVDEVLGGTAVATWTPGVPVIDQLELGIFGESRERITGTSPLTLEFGEHTRDDFFDDVKIMIQAPNPGAVVEQTATVEVSMQIRGGSGAFDYGSCSFG